MANYNVKLEHAKYDYLINDTEGYPNEIIEYLSGIEDYFTDDFIEFLADESVYGKRLNCSVERLMSKGIMNAIQSKDSDTVKKLIQSLIMFGVDVQSLVLKVSEERRNEIDSFITELAESGMVPESRAHLVMNSEDFKKFFNEHEKDFKDETIAKMLNEKKDISISERVMKILVRDASLEACMYYFSVGKIGKHTVELKKEIIAREKIVKERNERLERLSSIEIDKYEEEEYKIIVEDLSADQFYDMYQKGLIGEDILKRRAALDRSIIENASQYDERTTAEAISGLYFQRSVHNVCLDLGTIVRYCESKGIANEEAQEIAKLYGLLSGTTKFDKKEEYDKCVQSITNFLEGFDYSRINELIDQYSVEFGNELEEKIKESKHRLLSSENQVQIEGVDVPVYRIQNQSENQRNFFILTHSLSFEDAKKYYENQNPGMSLSVLDDNHFSTFSSAIRFGYDSLDGGEIVAANTLDGQTNQMNIFGDSGRRVMAKQLYSVEDFMNETSENSYNEIGLKFAGQRLKPTYIISYSDTPTKEENEIAIMFGIPILIIDREKYLQRDKSNKEESSVYYNLWYDVRNGRSIEEKKYQELKREDVEADENPEL